jgi:hypothetical protein
METKQIGLSKGQWLMANCGRFPSEKNCRLVLMAPTSQRADLLEAAATHAVASHGHRDTPELRKELDAMLESIEV